MSLAILTETEPVTDKEHGQLLGSADLAAMQPEFFYTRVANKPIPERWHVSLERSRLPYEALLHKSSFRFEHFLAPFHARQALTPQTIYTEQMPAWMSAQQLLEWVQLRTENAILRHENERLHRKLRALAPPRKKDERVQIAHDPAPSLDVYGFQLPVSLGSLAETIEQSRSLLQLEDDWDGAGTRGYAEQTWHRVVEFLVRYATALWEQHRTVTESLEILPDTEGALAIDWRTGNGELLITVPDNPAQEASYYADNGSGRRKSKGTLDTSVLERWLVCWLAE